MKNLLLTVFVLFLTVSFFAKAQDQKLVDNFDSSAVKNTYSKVNEGAATVMNYSDNHTDFQEGTGSFQANIVVGAFHDWGSYAEIQMVAPDSGYLDFSGYDSLSIWIKVYEAASQPANMVFRLQFRDRLSPTDESLPVEQYVYENAATLDATTGWYNLRVSIGQITSDGNVNPNDQGFVITPSSWGLPTNNEVLDYDKVISFGLVAVTTANIVDSVKVGFDDLTLFSPKAIPAIIFNGIAYGPSIVQPTWSWGQSSMAVEEGAGPVPNSNAIKWVQGDEWANGWTGIGADVNPAFNLAAAWTKDTLQFKMKAESGVGELRFQFEDGTDGGKRGWNFTPTDDNQWHTYKVALQDLIYPPGEDPTKYGPIDSSKISKVGFMAEGTGVAGKVIYITDWWSGNPEFDVIPPDAPKNVSSFVGDKQNIVMWDDVPGETGETYDVYYCANPFTSITDAGVETVVLGILENNGLVTHILLAPGTDQDVTYYYAVICKDASGNASVLSANSAPLTNTAKGVTTITMNAPTNFVADGDLSEWQSMTHFRMYPSDGSGHIVTNSTIDGDADCSADVWVGMDADYLYVAFDIFDDVFTPDISTSNWLNDAPDLFIGLYNYHGVSHTGYKRGAEPDYHFRFTYNKAVLDNPGATVDTLNSGNYYYGEAFGSGYRVEFRVKWTDLAAFGTGDVVFTPTEGFRIPIDFEINDADGAEREGMLTYAISEDKSYQDVSRWTYTWIGNLWYPTDVEQEGQTVTDYSLTQNYPNPFNPSTQIKFSIKETGLVSLKIFDLLGREVATIVNKELSTGSYTYSFDASSLASGIYFYRLESGSFVQTNKMMLLK
jgi:hypothetical protein